MSEKKALTDHPIQEFLSERWSPYPFKDRFGGANALRTVSTADLCSLFEAARGLWVHQMIGILADKARELFDIPEGYDAWTGMAIGYRGDPMTLPAALQQRDLTPRQRKPLEQFVFAEKWGNPSTLVLK